MTVEPRVVVDTNALISRLIIADSRTAHAVDKALETHRLIFSAATLEELRSVLLREKFASYASLEKRIGYIPELLLNADIVLVREVIKACRDPRDNKFLDLAVQGDARLIISGDEDLLALHPFMGIGIVSPAAFLQM